jgi:hypothetical protein
MSVHIYSYSESVVLERWSIRETDSGTRHFVGYSVMGDEGRVSTPLVTFDADSRTGTTASGSTYALVGRAGNDKDAEYVWSHAAREWKVRKWRDVTPELVPDWRMWLSKTERLARGDSEGDLTSFSEAMLEPVNEGEILRMESVRYRANAYIGHYADLQPGTKPLSSVTGSGSIQFLRPVPDDCVLRLLIATRVLLTEKMKRAQSVDEISFVSPCMAVTLESLPQADDRVAEQFARCDLAIDEVGVSAKLAIAGQPELVIGPLPVSKRQAIWELMLRMLPDWGDAGLISPWDAEISGDDLGILGQPDAKSHK